MIAVAILVGGIWFYRSRTSAAGAASAGPGGPAAIGAPGAMAIPVVVATATKGDLPVFYNGLGTVNVILNPLRSSATSCAVTCRPSVATGTIRFPLSL